MAEARTKHAERKTSAGIVSKPRMWTSACDYGIALCVGLFLFAFGWFHHDPMAYPDIWQAWAEVMRTAPAESILDSAWRFTARGLIRFMGMDLFLQAMRIAGSVCWVFSGFFLYFVYHSGAMLTLSPDVRHRRHAVISRVAAIAATMTCMLSLPIWMIGQAYHPASLLLVLAVFVFFLFFRYLETGSRASIFIWGVMGGVAATLSFWHAVILFFGLVILWALRQGHGPIAWHVQLSHLPRLRVRWVGVSCILGALLSFGLSWLAYERLGGQWCFLDASEVKTSSFFLLWVAHYATQVAQYFPLQGGLLLVVFCVLASMVFLELNLRTAVPTPLGWAGWVLIAAVVLSFIQLGAVTGLTVWPYSENLFFKCSICLIAGYVLCVMAMFYGSWAWVSQDRREEMHGIAQRLFLRKASSGEENTAQEQLPCNTFWAFFARFGRHFITISPIFGFLGFFCIILFCIFTALLRYAPTLDVRMLRVVNEYVRLTAQEIANEEWLVTDGFLDIPIQIQSNIAHHPIKTLNIFSERRGRDAWILAQMLPDRQEDRLLAEAGIETLIRDWCVRKSGTNTTKKVGTQLAFEIWQKADRTLTPLTATAIVVESPDQACALRNASYSHIQRLTSTIRDIYRRDPELSEGDDKKLRQVFLTMQWRLASLIRLHIRAFLAEGKTPPSWLIKCVEELDALNPVLRITRTMTTLRTPAKKTDMELRAAVVMLQEGKLDAAFDLLEKLLKDRKKDPHVKYIMGLTALARISARKAGGVLKTTIRGYDEGMFQEMCEQLVPLGETGRWYIAQLRSAWYEQTGALPEAYGQLRAVQRNNETNISFQLDLIRLALQTEDYDNIRTYAENVLRIIPENTLANYAMGLFWDVKKKWDRAEVYYARSLLLSPNNPAVLNNLALVLWHQGQREEAIRLATKALEMNPEITEIQRTLKTVTEDIPSDEDGTTAKP